MSEFPAATESVFLPGFDGVAELRADFVAALREHHPARAIGYPNRKLDTLNGYARFATGQVGADSRPILIAESFSGLVAARWASKARIVRFQGPHFAIETRPRESSAALREPVAAFFRGPAMRHGRP